MIIFKHKETGYKISLDELKELKLRDENKVLQLAQSCELKPYIYEDFIEQPKVKRYTYFVSNIPFSDDFEIINTDSLFTREELITIDNALMAYDIGNRCLDIRRKLHKELCKNLENRSE